ncbi:hypothetical protein GCM10007388_04940 [Pseudoduganella plicata]|uniref:Uncharacterized protein n=1 Tax=Pseudoduganella plicata TaxID=321984 RepID=A0AA87Y7M2_9BURK|nr:hypothetical protein GCM10007388_04940 [Pseudoduganella plicata]
MDAVNAALLAKLAQIVADLAVAVHAAAFKSRFLDRDEQTLVFLGTLTFRIQTPCIKATRMHFEHFAQPAHRELVL